MISITKKNVTITIEEKLLEKAKNRIPNISGFVEECLKNYLGEGKNLLATNRQHELIETISKCQLELYLLNKKENIEEEREKAKLEDIHLAWRKLYAYYRDTKTIDPDKLEYAVKKLGVPAEELNDIVIVAYAYQDERKIDITDWYEVYNEYGYGGDEN